LRVRRELPDDEVVIDFDEDARWLTVDRGPFRLACNFAAEAREVPVAAGHSEVVLTASPQRDAARIDGAAVTLPARSGALVR
jgi:hypothetical protein